MNLSRESRVHRLAIAMAKYATELSKLIQEKREQEEQAQEIREREKRKQEKEDLIEVYNALCVVLTHLNEKLELEPPYPDSRTSGPIPITWKAINS